MKIENTHWNPGTYSTPGKTPSDSTKAVRKLVVGDIKRIYHDDIKCTVCNSNRLEDYAQCSLSRSISMQRKKGWRLEYYHERPNVMVIRRIK